jgi:ABC-type branched-subunit amino acid transport system permease subunit
MGGSFKMKKFFWSSLLFICCVAVVFAILAGASTLYKEEGYSGLLFLSIGMVSYVFINQWIDKRKNKKSASTDV